MLFVNIFILCIYIIVSCYHFNVNPMFIYYCVLFSFVVFINEVIIVAKDFSRRSLKSQMCNSKFEVVNIFSTIVNTK